MEDSPFHREASVFMAKLAERAKSYDVMVKEITTVANNVEKLTEEEKNLVVVAYKNAIGPRMEFRRILLAIEQDKESGSNIAELIEEHEQETGKVIMNFGRDILHIMEKHCLIPSSIPTPTASVLDYKMKGDYQRYLAELKNDEVRGAYERSLKAYKDAKVIAKKNLLPQDPIRLGLAVSRSVLQSRVIQNYRRACKIAQRAIDKAKYVLDNVLDKEEYEDSFRVLDILQHNIELWKPKI